MRRHRPNLTLAALGSTLVLIAAACSSDGDEGAETVPAIEVATTIQEFVTDAGQFDESDETAEDDEAASDADEATDETSEEPVGSSPSDVTVVVATSTTAPADDASDDESDDDDPSATTQPPASGTTPATSSTIPPAGSPTTTAPPTETTAPPTTAAPATTNPPTTDPPAGSDAAAAALAGLTAVLTEVEVVDGASELPLCSLDPSGAQIDEIFESLDGAAFAEAYGSVTAPLAIIIDEQYGTMMTCDRFDGDFDNGIGVSAIPAPADLSAFSEAFANPEGVDGITVTVTPAGSGNGGNFFHVCSVDSVDPAFSYCEVDWISGGLMVTVWMAGAASADVDLASIQAAFAARLDAILTNLARAAG